MVPRRFAIRPTGFHNRPVSAKADAIERARAAARARPKRADPAAIHELFISRLEEIERRVTSELARPAEATGALQEILLDIAREVWAHVRAAGAHWAEPGGMSALVASLTAAGPVDELGIDESYADRVHDLLRPLSRAWFGLDARADIGPVDFEGPCLLLFNRGAHPLPVDPLVLWTFFREHAGRDGRRVYALTDPDTIAWPFLGDRLQRLGIFACSRGNCRVLLERGATVIAFPEGERARAKTYERRYRLERFDDGYLVETAMSCGAKIVPGGVLGNEESFPLIAHAAGLPVSPLFPWTGLLGLLPLPVTWRIRLAPPVRYADDVEHAARAGVVLDSVRARMQELLVELLARRRTILGG